METSKIVIIGELEEMLMSIQSYIIENCKGWNEFDENYIRSILDSISDTIIETAKFNEFLNFPTLDIDKFVVERISNMTKEEKQNLPTVYAGQDIICNVCGRKHEVESTGRDILFYRCNDRFFMAAVENRLVPWIQLAE